MNLTDYDLILVNTSGGKDSQTMIRRVVALADAQGVPRSRITAVHANLGRVEWPGTAELAARQVAAYGLRFEIVNRESGDLLDQVEARKMWPSAAARYCTSDQKRDQIMKLVTRLDRAWREGRSDRKRPVVFRVLNCLGIRAQESPERSKYPASEPNTRASNRSRQVTQWHPILDWSERQVWDDIRASGIEYAQAYDLGMPRLSCMFCIFAPKSALLIAGRANPELLNEYVRIERSIDHTFKPGFAIAEIKAELDAERRQVAA